MEKSQVAFSGWSLFDVDYPEIRNLKLKLVVASAFVGYVVTITERREG